MAACEEFLGLIASDAARKVARKSLATWRLDNRELLPPIVSFSPLRVEDVLQPEGERVIELCTRWSEPRVVQEGTTIVAFQDACYAVSAMSSSQTPAVWQVVGYQVLSDAQAYLAAGQASSFGWFKLDPPEEGVRFGHWMERTSAAVELFKRETGETEALNMSFGFDAWLIQLGQKLALTDFTESLARMPKKQELEQHRLSRTWPTRVDNKGRMRLNVRSSPDHELGKYVLFRDFVAPAGMLAWALTLPEFSHLVPR